MRELFSRFPSGEVDALVGSQNQALGISIDGGMKVIRKPLLSWRWHKGGIFGHFIYAIILLGHAFMLCKRKKYDLIICGDYFPNGLVALALSVIKKIPYSVFYYGEEIYGIWGIRIKLNKIVMKYAANLVAISLNTKKLLVQAGAFSDKIIVCTPCVDYDHFVPACDINHVKSELGLKDKKVILTVARLLPRKGHKRAITALARIKDKHESAILVIVGPDFGYGEAIRQHISNCELEKSVLLMGNVSDEDLLKLYQACDVFVMVSDTGPNNDDLEGFGITFLEANACGKPVIGGNSGGMPEAIENGCTGFIVDSNNDLELENMLNFLLENSHLASELGSNGRNRVMKMFNYDQRSSYLRCSLGRYATNRLDDYNTLNH